MKKAVIKSCLGFHWAPTDVAKGSAPPALSLSPSLCPLLCCRTPEQSAGPEKTWGCFSCFGCHTSPLNQKSFSSDHPGPCCGKQLFSFSNFGCANILTKCWCLLCIQFMPSRKAICCNATQGTH